MSDQLTVSCDADVVGLERTRFFPRQLVGAADLTQDQVYFREKLRRHNRMLHGWGVVCGADVCKAEASCAVVVDSGYVLGPYGDEIVIDRVTIDLCREDTDGAATCLGRDVDPWCANVRVDRTPGQRLYLAVRYAECPSSPVRVPSLDCGCNDDACEYSRTRDTAVFKVLTSLPSTYSDPMPNLDLGQVTQCTRDADCLDCPDEPWVILADVILGSDGEVKEIDCYSHRRNVVSYGSFYFLCRPDKGSVGVMASASLSKLIGRPALADLSLGISPPKPLLTVPAKLANGSLAALPVYFEARSGETLGEMLEREGGRTFYDPSNDDTFTLREAYEAAGAEPTMPVETIEDAVRPLENLSLARVGDTRVIRRAVEDTLNEEGIRRLDEAGGNPSAALELPASTLLGVGHDAPLAARTTKMSIGEIAGLSRDEFVSNATRRVAANRVVEVERAAGELHDRARRIARLSEALHE